MCVGKAREVIKSCSVLSPASAGLRQALDLFENFGQNTLWLMRTLILFAKVRL